MKLKTTKIGEIPENWDVVRLGDISKFKYGLGEKAQEAGEYVYLRITDIKADGTLQRNGLAHIDKNKVGRDCILKKGDVLVARTGATYAKTYLFNEDFAATYGGFLIKFLLNEEKIDNNYFFQFTRSKQYWNQANNLVGGGAQPQFNANVISELLVPLPPLPKQKAIAKILSEFDLKIKLNTQINQTLEQMAQTIFKHWFVDFEFPNEDGKPYKSSGGEMQDSELGEIPQGWRIKKLREILNHSKDVVSPSDKPEATFLHYSLPTFDAGHLPLKEKGRDILSNKFLVKKNSILVSKLNPRIPRIWPIGDIEEGESICSTEFQVFVPKESFYYSFIISLFSSQSVIDVMKGMACGTSGSHQRISPDDILDIDFILPNDEILIKFNSILRKHFEKSLLNLQQSDCLSEIRDLLLPKLMSGEITPIEAGYEQ